jgi:hypothetical protein
VKVKGVGGIGDLCLPVELSSFTVFYAGDQAVLHWTTESETDNLGYHVYRSLTEDGDYERITATVIKGAGSSWEPHSYQFIDGDVQPGQTYFYKLEQIDFEGTKQIYGPKTIKTTPRYHDIAVREAVPTRYALYQNTPNPFNPGTTIAYDLPEGSNVTLTIYSITGQEGITLVSDYHEAGHYEVTWDSSGYGNGVYLYRLETRGFVETRRMVLLR